MRPLLVLAAAFLALVPHGRKIEQTASYQDLAAWLGSTVPATGVPYGVTVCLTGGLTDLIWEGRTSFIRPGLLGVRTIARSATPAGADLAVLGLPER